MVDAPVAVEQTKCHAGRLPCWAAYTSFAAVGLVMVSVIGVVVGRTVSARRQQAQLKRTPKQDSFSNCVITIEEDAATDSTAIVIPTTEGAI
jgi:hypothetical protein